MKTLITLLALGCFVITATAQPAIQTAGGHKLPFASQNNTIELAVANAATVDAGNVTVEAQNVPQWLTFTNPRQTEGGQVKTQIPNLKSGEVSTARFTFSVEKNAPVNQQTKLQFLISSPTGERWTKEIAFQVSPPEKFELFQNYPNPFNPSTKISYQLPSDAKVRIIIYNTLGQEVTTLFDGIRSAGYYQEIWNARGVASGMYIYQIITEMSTGKKEIARKTMLLVK